MDAAEIVVRDSAFWDRMRGSLIVLKVDEDEDFCSLLRPNKSVC
jgi:hypothetical protein